jgi:hypothetical protein
MEVSKLAKSQEPLAKKPKIEQDEELEKVPGSGSPTTAGSNERAVHTLDVYRHRDTGEHFSLSAKKKLIGRVNAKTKELFESKSPEDMIEDGTLVLIGTRHVRPDHHGVFHLTVDDKNRKIEIAFQGNVSIFAFDIDQEILDILLEGEENFTRVEEDGDKAEEDGYHTSKDILKELFNLKPEECTDLKSRVDSIFATANVEADITDCHYETAKESLVFKDAIKGRCYVRKLQVLPATIFQLVADAVAATADDATDVAESFPEKGTRPTRKAKAPAIVEITPPPSPKPEVVKVDSESDDNFSDTDSDESQLFTTDESSESNDEGSDDPGYYGGSIKQWKSSSNHKKSKKKKKKEEWRRQREKSWFLQNERKEKAEEREERLRLKAERAAERKANRPERKERKRLKREKREKRKAEEGPAIVEMTKKILSMDLKPKQNIDLETLEAELRENATTGGRSRLYAIMVIFRGFRIVQKVKDQHNKYKWLGRDDEEINRVLTSMLESSTTTDEILWNICSEICQALMTARKGSRIFLPIISESFGNTESRRLNIAASVLEGMDMVDKMEDELGGLVYKGQTKAYEEFMKNLLELYGTEHKLKKMKLHLPHVEVKEEHRYPIDPPQFVNKYRVPKDVEIPEVPEELKDDTEIQRAIANLDKVCRCGSMKELEDANVIHREGHKSHIRTKVLVGGKRKNRCKKCTGCLAKPCKKCIFCIKKSMKKPCERRKCLFPVVPNCPCFT